MACFRIVGMQVPGDTTTIDAIATEITGRMQPGALDQLRQGADSVIRDMLQALGQNPGLDEGPATRWRDGVANLGQRPTFAGDDLILEVYLFDFDARAASFPSGAFSTR